MGSGDFLNLLHDWQALAGALVIAVALLLTVGLGLGAERRRRNAEAHSMAVALGTELRAIARCASSVQEEVLKLLPPVNPNLMAPPRTLRDLQSVIHFPDALIYAHAGPGVGALGEFTSVVVSFYHELWKVRDDVANLWTSSAMERQMVSVPSAQLLDIADALLKAIAPAAAVLPELAGGAGLAADQAFAREVAAAQERLADLRKAFSFRP